MALNAAVIGLGVGTAHIVALRDTGAQVRAICDVNEDLLNKVADEYGVEGRYTDFRDLAGCDDIDLVSICTPDHLHTDAAVAMMDSGKHVLVEKPLAMTFEDVQRITETARRTGRKVSHGCQLRFLPQFQEVKRQVFKGGWRGDLGRECNVMAGGGIHPIDVVRWIVDDWVEEVSAYGNGIATQPHGLDVTDCVVALMRFQRGCVGRSLVSVVAARPGLRNVHVYGTQRTYVTVPGPPQNQVSSADTGTWEPLSFSDERKDPRHALVADLIRAIERDADPEIDLDQSTHVAAVCIAAFESVRTGKPVKVPTF
jgi:predicted dehydrogenase